MKNRIESVYKKTERFAEVTKKAIISGNIVRAKKLLTFAEQMLETGSSETQAAISSMYVHTVSTFLGIRHCSISSLFPQKLKAEYIRQINSTNV